MVRLCVLQAEIISRGSIQRATPRAAHRPICLTLAEVRSSGRNARKSAYCNRPRRFDGRVVVTAVRL